MRDQDVFGNYVPASQALGESILKNGMAAFPDNVLLVLQYANYLRRAAFLTDTAVLIHHIASLLSIPGVPPRLAGSFARTTRLRLLSSSARPRSPRASARGT